MTADDRSILERIEKKVDRISNIIEGGDDPSTGFVVRMDRLEQAQSRRTWLTQTAVGALIVSIVAMVKTWMK